MNLFELGNFTLASGQPSGWKIECDALTDADWTTLAVLLHDRIKPFGWVIGVPKGGWPLANKLQTLRTPDSDITLFVDDVWTTGISMTTYIKSFHQLQNKPLKKAVVFARLQVPDDVSVLFQMTKS